MRTVEKQQSLPDVSYVWPAADLPGCRDLLHEDVSNLARQFLENYFDSRTGQLEGIKVEAKKYKQGLDELGKALGDK